MATAEVRRPWPVPERRWTMAQTWHDVLFMHWPVTPTDMRALVPSSLELDTFDGMAWISIVPFWMSGVRPRYLPPVRGLSSFPELNVRTYVVRDGKPGVYFFSLDAGNPIAVEIARRRFGLPYYRARMSHRWNGDIIDYASQRNHAGAPRASLRVRYRPGGELLSDVGPGTLAWWLTGRYCLYTVDEDNRPSRLEIDHVPWPLQPAEADVTINTMTVALGLDLHGQDPVLHFSRRLDIRAWPAVRLT